MFIGQPVHEYAGKQMNRTKQLPVNNPFFAVTAHEYPDE
jgi:hypothetical protein